MLNQNLKVKIFFYAILVCGIFGAGVNAVSAETYYVDKSGNDSNQGTQVSPWLTIQKAADIMVAGDTVNVNSGNYGGDASVFLKTQITTSGSAGQQITYQAIGTVLTQGFLVSADYITIKGFDIEDPHDHRIASSTSHDYRGGTGIFVEGSYNIIEDNYVHGCVWEGIILSKSGTFLVPSNTIIRNNRLFRNGMTGIDVAGRNNLIEENEVWASIQYHPGNIEHATETYLDADGMRFFGSGHTFRNNYIHDIRFGAPGVNLNPEDPDNIYDMANDYNDDPHIDGFQTWQDAYHEIASSIIFEGNLVEILETQDTNENGHGWMIAGGANHLTIKNNIIKVHGGINTGGGGNADYLYIYNNLWINDLSFSSFWPNALALANVPHAIIKNNIFYDQPYHTITITGEVVSHDIDYNLAYNSDASVPDCIRVDYVCQDISSTQNLWNVNPQFFDPADDDYHLTSPSPAIGAAVTISDVIADYEGTIRPQGVGYDIGAYEYTPSGDIIPPSSPSGLNVN